jgi:quercetin 2,3-dioxygenase
MSFSFSLNIRSQLTSPSFLLEQMHAEMPIHRPGGDNPTGLQLWIDLPSAHKLTEASYQELKASEIPSAHPSPNVLVKVICGTAEGSEEEGEVKSPVRPLGGCWFFDVQFGAKGEKFWQAIPKGWNAFVRPSLSLSALPLSSSPTH